MTQPTPRPVFLPSSPNITEDDIVGIIARDIQSGGQIFQAVVRIANATQEKK